MKHKEKCNKELGKNWDEEECEGKNKMTDKFECELCGGTFKRTLPADKAIKEFKDKFGTLFEDEVSLVCNDCYEIFMDRQTAFLIENWDVSRMTRQ